MAIAIFCYLFWGVGLAMITIISAVTIANLSLICSQKYVLIAAILSIAIIFLTREGGGGEKLARAAAASVLCFILICLIRRTIQARKNFLPADKEREPEKMAKILQMARLGKITGGVTHDLANQLSLVMLGLEMVKKKAINKNAISLLNQTKLSAENMKRLLGIIKEQLNGHAASEKFSLNDEITKVIKLYNFTLQKNEIKLSFCPNCRAYFFGNPARFSQAMFNLIGNAIDALEGREDSKIYLNLYQGEKEIIISIKDNGPGFTQLENEPEKNKEHLGLGISIVKQVIESECKGNVELFADCPSGACAIIHLPRKE
jgi:signal transduction histidine kinase